MLEVCKKRCDFRLPTSRCFYSLAGEADRIPPLKNDVFKQHLCEQILLYFCNGKGTVVHCGRFIWVECYLCYKSFDFIDVAYRKQFRLSYFKVIFLCCDKELSVICFF